MPWQHISIKRLEMNNFKSFNGWHSIDLLPQKDKPIILIGGHNMRGKTSIHEAINYCLYEDDDLPGIQTRPNYLRAVSERLNRFALDDGKTDYRVALELIAKGKGIDAERQLRIERTWKVNIHERRVVDIKLDIFENERPMDGIDKYSYQEFLRNLLPPRIAPFFFFDGERIQEFAEDSPAQMVESIEDILHINVYTHLRDDLKSYVIEHIEKYEVEKQSQDDFFKIQEDKERIENDLENKKEEIADTEHEIDELTRKQKQTEEELRRIASPHDSKRGELISEQSRLEQEIYEAKTQLQKTFEPLPILLTGNRLRDDLRQKLEEEQRQTLSPERIDELRLQMEDVKQRTFAKPEPPFDDLELNKSQKEYYYQSFDNATEIVFDLRKLKLITLLHDIGEAGRNAILEKQKRIENQGAYLQEIIDRRERLENELRDIRIKLQSTSDDPHISELIKDTSCVSELIGKAKEKQTNLDEDIQRLQADLATRNRQIEERQTKRAATTQAKKAIKIAQKARSVLDEFIKQLAPEKLEILKNHMKDMYFRLRKTEEDPVHSIEVDPQTWQIILKDEKERPLEKRVFSQGMKEMYALSLLWALSKSSGRELPIVIDTPAGRLDTTNRRSLFEKYLPYAGHQVIVLSTDTEVDVQWAQRLSPYVSQQYCLDYDAKAKTTVIRPGYFF